MSEGLLFAYGALRPSHAPARLARALGGARSLGRARTAGVLYDLVSWTA